VWNISPIRKNNVKDIIESLKKAIEQGTSSSVLNQTFELLIKAQSIEILRPKAEEGMGFAMEAISRIAASETIPPSAINTSNDEHNG
jgi:hypothetical protein